MIPDGAGARAAGLIPVLAAVLSLIPAAGDEGHVDARPNLVMLVPAGVFIGRSDWPATDPAIRFWTGVANAGNAPMDLRGDPLHLEASPARQCVRWALPHVCTVTREAGSFWLRPGDRCWRLQGFLRYELRSLGDPGDPGRVIASSGLVDHTVLDRGWSSEHQRLDEPSRLAGSFASCTHLRQGVSPGWVSSYDADLEGQAIPIGGVPDGRYALVAVVDPRRALVDADRNDDCAWILVELTGAGTGVGVVTAPAEVASAQGNTICQD